MSSKGLHTILFDLDGTLIDSAELILVSWRHTMVAHFGEAPPDHHWLETVGQPLRTQFRQFADSDQEAEVLIRTYLDHNHQVHDDFVRPFPAVRETLLGLRERGVRMGVVTSKATRGTKLGLRACDLDESWFDTIITSDEPVPHKPDPAPVRLALDRMGVRAAGTAFVGDSVWDLRSGRAAGVTTIGALWGPFSRELLAGEEPDMLLDDIEALLAA
ncbi:MAG: HAD family hydrolase [Longimicrobiales bacterium]